MKKTNRAIALIIHPDKVGAVAPHLVAKANEAFGIFQTSSEVTFARVRAEGVTVITSAARVPTPPSTAMHRASWAAAPSSAVPSPASRARHQSHDGMSESEREAHQAVESGWRFLPGYESLPEVPLWTSWGYLVAKPFQIPFPPAPEQLDEVMTEAGIRASWQYALIQSVDSAFRLFRPAGYTSLPSDNTVLGTWLDIICRAEGHHCPPPSGLSSPARPAERG